MRLVSSFKVFCPCSATVEWPDSQREHKCPRCGRLLIVAGWPNHPLLTLAAGEAYPSARVAEKIKSPLSGSAQSGAGACV
jgi:hypothetical protein